MTSPWTWPEVITHTRLLLDAFEQALHRPLMPRSGDDGRDAEARYRAPFVVVSHGTEEDPILNYGNAAALALWETDWATLTRLPSRLTAEPVAREERAAMLERARRDGFIDNYAGVRLTASGRRFRIENAVVWNLADSQGRPAGQAASFADWHFLRA
jgi:hypothetical protein